MFSSNLSKSTEKKQQLFETFFENATQCCRSPRIGEFLSNMWTTQQNFEMSHWKKKHFWEKKHLSLTFSPRNRQGCSSTPRRVGCEFVFFSGSSQSLSPHFKGIGRLAMSQECWRKMIQWSRCSLRIFFGFARKFQWILVAKTIGSTSPKLMNLSSFNFKQNRPPTSGFSCWVSPTQIVQSKGEDH